MTLTSLRDVRSGLEDYRAKVCSTCRETKPLSEFPIRRSRPCGFAAACKKCAAAWAKNHRPPQVRSDLDKRRRSERQRLRLYGVTVEQVAEMRQRQDDRCAICRTDEPRGRGDFHVDHDHDSGRVRGLLCHKCNVRLGIIEGWYFKNRELIDDFIAA